MSDANLACCVPNPLTRRFVTIVVLCAAVVAAVLGTASPAHAWSRGTGQDIALSQGSLWGGSYQVEGARWWCAAMNGYASPDRHSRSFGGVMHVNGSTGGSWLGRNSEAASVGPYGSYTIPLYQSGPDLNQPNSVAVMQSGRSLTGSNLDRIGYLLGRYGDTTNPATARTLALVIKEKFQVVQSSAWRLNISQSQATRDAMNALWNEAILMAGPYTASGAIQIDEGGTTGRVVDHGVLSRRGNVYAGASWTMTITSGNATWASNGSTVRTGTTGSALGTAAFNIAPGNAGEVVEIDMLFSNLPDHRIQIRQTTNASDQAIMRGGVRALDRNVNATIPDHPQFAINVATTTSHEFASAGTALTDQLNVSLNTDLVPNPWEPVGHPVTIVSTLYGPFASMPVEQAMVPTGAPVVGSVTTVVTEPGVYTTPSITVPTNGVYVWSETAVADEFFFGHRGRFAVPSEITVVPWTPVIQTAIGSGTFASGDSVSDFIEISGAQPGVETNVTAQLYRHPSSSEPVQQATIPAGAVEIGAVQNAVIIADEDGTGAALVGVTLPDDALPGWYTWVVSSAETVTQTAYVSDYGIPAETGVINWNPEAITDLSANTFRAGDTIEDLATFSGGQPGATADVVFTLYGQPAREVTQQAHAPIDAWVIDRHRTTVTFDGDGGATSTAPFTIPADFDGGAVSVVLNIEENDTMNAWVSDYGIPEESARFLAPGHATTEASLAVSDLDDVGGHYVLSDWVNVTGIPGNYGALPDEREELYVDLFFVPAGFTGDLTTQCVANNLVATTTVPVANGRHQATHDAWQIPITYETTYDGTYLFVHRFAGTARVTAFEGECAEPAETVELSTSPLPPELALTGYNHFGLFMLLAFALPVVGVGFVRYGRKNIPRF